MTNVIIHKVNESYIRFECDRGILNEISDQFTFYAPNFQYHPKYKNKLWDGKIRLLDGRTKRLYKGLLGYVEQFCQDNEYSYEVAFDNTEDEFSVHEAKKFIEVLKLPEKLETRDYQLDTFIDCVRHKRRLFVSPTASGKSLMIYFLSRYYHDKKILIVVPRINLINQMFSDFEDYGFNSENEIHKIYAGQEKYTNKRIVLTTWQSVYEMDPEWFEQFEVIIGDEAHNFKATSLISIMTNLVNCEYRFGFTGSLDGSATNKITLEGLFGPFKQIVTTKELMEQGHVSELDLRVIIFSYPDEICKIMKNLSYQEEYKWIINNQSRNRFITNLALSLQETTLVLFTRIDHGKHLHSLLENQGRKIFLIYGAVDGDVREEIRQLVIKEPGAIILASVGVFSEGVNIPNLHNTINTSPGKSRVKAMQTIGRGIRKHDDKEKSTYFDLADDLQWKKRKNHTYLHLLERIKYYNQEKFKFKLYKVKLKDV